MSLVEKFLDYLAADKGYSLRTIEAYRNALEQFENFFRNVDTNLEWETLDSDVIRNWVVERLENGLSERSMTQHLSAVRSFYRFLLLTKVVEKDPSHLVRNPKVGKQLPTFLKQSEMDRLLDEVNFTQDFEGRRDHLILLTFYSTGVRVSELVGLERSDVDFSQRQLKVTGKRNKQRIIPFGEELLHDMKLYEEELQPLTGQNNGPLFVDNKGQRLSTAQVRCIVEKYLSKVTLQKKKSPHVLRHTFATVMLNNGADLEAVKELLGHESLATTEIYTHTTFAELKKEYENAHPRA